MHPYEMRKQVRERGKEQFLDLRPGSLYRAIERLEKAGLIEPVETHRQGRFPERTVYQLNELGRMELEAWMRDLLSAPGKDWPALLGALSYLAVLSPEDVQARLAERCMTLEAEIAGLESEVKQLEDTMPRLFLVEDEYAIALRRAELHWVRALVADLRSGRLRWDVEEVLRAYSPPSPPAPSKLTVVEGGEPPEGSD